jgi:hypothetical protein
MARQPAVADRPPLQLLEHFLQIGQACWLQALNLNLRIDPQTSPPDLRLGGAGHEIPQNLAGGLAIEEN